MRRVKPILLVVAGLLCVSAWTETVSSFLRAPQPDGEPTVRRPVSGEEAVQENPGAHQGHRVLLCSCPKFECGRPNYQVRYQACLETEKHSSGGEVVAKEGMSGIGLTGPTGANWYGGGCIDVRLDGRSVGDWRPDLLYERWRDRGRVRAVYDTPMGHAVLIFTQMRDDDKLLVEGRVEPEDVEFQVRLRCFPGGFHGKKRRWAATAERNQEVSGQVMLRPGEPWILCADALKGVSSDEKSLGCAAAMFDPAQTQRAVLEVTDYPIYLTIDYPRRQRAFHLALWEFPGRTNEERLAYMRRIDEGLQKSSGLLMPAAEPVQVQAPEGTIVSDGEAAATIVLREDPSDELLHAARQLRTYIQRMSGALLPVAVADTDVTGNRIVLGAEETARQGGTQFPADLGDEAYVIRSAGRDLVILGGSDLGTFYGVCGLLEDHLGVRWYVPGDPLGECVREAKQIVLADVNDRQSPSFPMRWIGRGHWANMNRQNRGGDGLRAGFKIEPGIYHTQNKLLPHAEYFDEHPEYFALIDGERSTNRQCKLCYSNPETAKAVAASMARMLDGQPDINLISFSPTDGQLWCQCADCRAMDEEDVPRDQRMSRRSLIFYNRLAAELRKTHPDAEILVGAYNVYNWPPRDRTTKADPMLSVIITHYEQYCMAHAVPDPDCPRNQRYVELVKQWEDLGCDIYYYEYYYKANWSDLPWPIVHSIKGDMPWYDERGHRGVYTQFTTRNAWTLYPAYYVAAKLMWDVEADVEAIFDEMCNRLFGKAGPAMREYYRVQEERMADCGHHFPGHGVTAGTWVFTDDVLGQMADALERAREVAEDQRVRQRLDKIELSYQYTRMMMEFANNMRAAFEQTEPAKIVSTGERALEAYDSVRDEIVANPQKWRGVTGPGAVKYPFVTRRVERLRDRVEATKKRAKWSEMKTVGELPQQWRFRLDPEDVGQEQGWFRPDFDTSDWETIAIGKTWEEQGHEGYDGFAWYRVEFEVAKEWTERGAELAFGGVDGEAWVYLNGQLAAHHEGWDEPFGVKLRADAVKPGERNCLAVRVWDGARQGGIYREVSVKARPHTE